MRGRFIATLAGAALALCFLGSASADGEAGLVIQDGNTVRTYCVAFTGDGVRGDQLLTGAGQTFDAYGGGSGLAVCSINALGCNDAGSFASCFCQCQGGDCTYWAFFTQEYGKGWVYSARAFNLLSARDGEVHGWKWGGGNPNSAPAPQPVTFEQICGHSPGGGAASTATATAIQPTATSALPTTPPATTSTAIPRGSVAAASATASTTASSTAGSGSVTPLVTLPGMASPTPAAPDTSATLTEDESTGGSGSGLAVVAGIVGVLAIAIVAATVWRNRRES